MPCWVCRFARQLCLNVVLAADKNGNLLLLGSPNETISQRTARARETGKSWARIMCRIFTAMFFWMKRDHCSWALEAGSIAEELWHWSPPEPIVAAPDLSARLLQADPKAMTYNPEVLISLAFESGFRQGVAAETKARNTK